MRQTLFALVAAAALSACVSFGAGGPPDGPLPPSAPDIGGPGLPGGQLDLGDYARSDADAVARAFAGAVERRYRAGLPTSTAVADLRAAGFACEAVTNRRGEPPSHTCTAQRQVDACGHTWEVLVYADAGDRVTEARGLYDRLCRGSGLLGAPPR